VTSSIAREAVVNPTITFVGDDCGLLSPQLRQAVLVERIRRVGVFVRRVFAVEHVVRTDVDEMRTDLLYNDRERKNAPTTVAQQRVRTLRQDISVATKKS
jgi:hypothetical protein